VLNDLPVYPLVGDQNENLVILQILDLSGAFQQAKFRISAGLFLRIKPDAVDLDRLRVVFAFRYVCRIIVSFHKTGSSSRARLPISAGSKDGIFPPPGFGPSFAFHVLQAACQLFIGFFPTFHPLDS
jgi:hypothetical protein